MPFVSGSEPPTDNLSARKVAIAFCVGYYVITICTKCWDQLNSLITAPEPPSLTHPVDGLIPSKSNSALIVTIPGACCGNNSPALKLPSWICTYMNTLPPLSSSTSFSAPL